MTKTKDAHTPGPWTVGQHPMLEVASIPSDGDLARRSIICGVNGSHVGVGMANARLIAAAPDLLAVAIRLLKIAEQDYREPRAVAGDNFDCEPWVQEARAAIAKAEGREVSK